MLVRIQGKGDPHLLMVGLQTGVAAIETDVENSQNTKSRFTGKQH